MQKMCDLFVPRLTEHAELRFLSLFDKSFDYNQNAIYEGFINVNIKRIKLVNFIMEFNKKNIQCFNVPIEYRDRELMTKEESLFSLTKYKKDKGVDVSFKQDLCSPLYWGYEIINDPEQKVGGLLYVDKIDGHIWTLDEYEEYHYDYNNFLF